MSIIDLAAELAGPNPTPATDAVWGRPAPTPSADLHRILAIPRRDVTEHDKAAMCALMKERLARPPRSSCRCKNLGRDCITELKPAQGWALFEIGIVGGLLGSIVVGGGKTGLGLLAPMVLSGCNSVVLIVPATLQKQLLDEYLLWREHWYLPHIMFGASGTRATGEYRRDSAGQLPTIHVISYSKLSQASSTQWLEIMKPDAIIGDEIDKLRNSESARGIRFCRFMDAHPQTLLLGWSGSLLNCSIKDVTHIAGYALKANSPFPLDKRIVEDWAQVIDPPPRPDMPPPKPGALAKLTSSGESIANAFRRRVLQTRGVVATHGADLAVTLRMLERDPGSIPIEVQRRLFELRSTGQRPDGEDLMGDPFAIARCARELACGFYYYWYFPKIKGQAQSRELIERWYDCRKRWNAEVRAQLTNPAPHLDSPKLLKNAAERFYSGDYHGPLPMWESQHYSEWIEIEKRVVYESRAEWISDYLVNDAAEWAREHRGIVWCDFRAFGERLSQVSGLPYHTGGPKAEDRIKAERGDRSIVASIKAHGRGRDGLQYLFHKQLVANPPTSRKSGGAPMWEQLLGREHRHGQKAEHVLTWMYRHTDEMRDAWDRAQQMARFVTNTMGNFQKINNAQIDW